MKILIILILDVTIWITHSNCISITILILKTSACHSSSIWIKERGICRCRPGYAGFPKKHCHSCFWSQCDGDVIVMSESSMKTNIWRWWWWWSLRMVPLRSRYNDWWGDREKMLIVWITRKRFQMRSGYRQRWIPGQRSKLQRQVNTSIGQTRQSKQFKSLNLNIQIKNSRVGVEGGWGG